MQGFLYFERTAVWLFIYLFICSASHIHESHNVRRIDPSCIFNLIILTTERRNDQPNSGHGLSGALEYHVINTTVGIRTDLFARAAAQLQKILAPFYRTCRNYCIFLFFKKYFPPTQNFHSFEFHRICKPKAWLPLPKGYNLAEYRNA